MIEEIKELLQSFLALDMKIDALCLAEQKSIFLEQGAEKVESRDCRGAL